MDFKNWLENDEPKKKLYIMRGISGSGKSTLAKKIAQESGGVIYSTDDYLEGKTEEEYEANFKNAQEKNLMHIFHKKNLDRTVEAMKKGISPIIVDNTNIEKGHMEPYVQAAYVYDYDVEFAEPEPMRKITELLRDRGPNANRLQWAAAKMAGRNVHGLGYENIMKQINKWHVDPKSEDFT
jgi:predicted kinase